MLHPPFALILTWPTPNYVNPVTNGHARAIIIWTLTPLVLAAIVLRYYTRLRVTKSFGIDDILIGVAVVRRPGHRPSWALAVC